MSDDLNVRHPVNELSYDFSEKMAWNNPIPIIIFPITCYVFMYCLFFLCLKIPA